MEKPKPYGTKKRVKQRRKKNSIITQYYSTDWDSVYTKRLKEAVMSIWESIENLYNIGELHKCYGYEVAQILDIDRVPSNCGHRVSDQVLCPACENLLRKDDKYFKCVVSNCKNMRQHGNIYSLRKCKCFIPTCGQVTMRAFITLLMIMRRYVQVPPSLRKYMLYRICGEPLGYYIKDTTIHTVPDVRWIKQDMINGIMPKCNELKQDCLSQLTPVFLRLKYMVLNKLRDEPLADYILVPDIRTTEITDAEFIALAERMGFKLTIGVEKKIKMNYITWATTLFDSSILKTDPRYGLLQYNQ